MSFANTKITKCVIPCAGLGTRFLSVTKTIPKEMLPIVNTPVIEYVIDECRKSGLTEVLIVVSKSKSALINYFKPNFKLENKLMMQNKMEILKTIRKIGHGINISFIIQNRPLGLGHAIKLSKHFTKNEPFAVILPDELMVGKIPSIKQCINVFNKHHATILGFQPVLKKTVNQYGILQIDANNKVSNIIEKPSIKKAPSNLSACGRYIFLPSIYKNISKIPNAKQKEIGITEAINKLAIHESVYGCKISNQRYDIGSKNGYILANIYFALKDKNIGQNIKNYIKQLE